MPEIGEKKDEEITIRKAIDEIKKLRSRNYEMSLRLKMFDDVMMLINTNPNRGGSECSPDVVWDLEVLLKSKNSTENTK